MQETRLVSAHTVEPTLAEIVAGVPKLMPRSVAIVPPRLGELVGKTSVMTGASYEKRKRPLRSAAEQPTGHLEPGCATSMRETYIFPAAPYRSMALPATGQRWQRRIPTQASASLNRAAPLAVLVILRQKQAAVLGEYRLSRRRGESRGAYIRQARATRSADSSYQQHATQVVPVPAGVTHATAVVEIQTDASHLLCPMVTDGRGMPSDDLAPKFVPRIVRTDRPSVGPFALPEVIVTIGASYETGQSATIVWPLTATLSGRSSGSPTQSSDESETHCDRWQRVSPIRTAWSVSATPKFRPEIEMVVPVFEDGMFIGKTDRTTGASYWKLRGRTPSSSCRVPLKETRSCTHAKPLCACAPQRRTRVAVRSQGA